MALYKSPFLLSATVEHHLDETNTAIAKQIKDHIYVDNLITGTNDDEEAFPLYKEAKNIFQDAPMNPCTSPDDQMKERLTNVFRLIWNINTDEFSISTRKLENTEQAKTKREVLASLAAFFDPLGMTTPVTLKMKLFLQELWGKKKNGMKV